MIVLALTPPKDSGRIARNAVIRPVIVAMRTECGAAPQIRRFAISSRTLGRSRGEYWLRVRTGLNAGFILRESVFLGLLFVVGEYSPDFRLIPVRRKLVFAH